MDSLFDASLFDAAPYEAAPASLVEPDPPEEPSLAEVATDEVVAVASDDIVETLRAEDVVPIDPDDDEEDVTQQAVPASMDVAEVEVDESILREPSVDELWTNVVGQESAVAQLRASTLAPVHAYLFFGPAGVGKLESARAFAAALLCPRGGCGHCSVCVRALAQAHPDLVVVEREGASISVDQAREILRLALRSPIEGDRKVLVLVDFHLVTVAAPTLLKIIEEPPPSTVFVVLAEQVTPELVTIASRCVQIPFSVLSRAVIIDTLIAEGAGSVPAGRAADVAGGRLDRARLLVNDPSLAERLAFWEQIPARLDGTGAAVSVIADETVALLDGAAVGPLVVRQEAEAKALDARLEASGARGGAGARKELAERHKREQKRVRDDELRFGLGVLSRRYAAVATALGELGQRLAEPTPADHERVVAALRAVEALQAANEHLERNPNLALLLQSLLLRLPPIRS